MFARITPKRLGSTGPSGYCAGLSFGIAPRSRQTGSYAPCLWWTRRILKLIVDVIRPLRSRLVNK
jgi:hypothetical protein